MKFRNLTAATKRGSRLEQLQTLADILASEIDKNEDARNLPQLSRQYRETMKEIEEIENSESTDDEIGEILSERSADGKPGAVRKNRP